MAKRLVFNAPVAVQYRAIEIDSITSVDPVTGEVTGFYSLIPVDGKRVRSIPFSVSASNQVDNLAERILNRLASRTEKIDGQDVPLAGTIVDANVGDPVPLR